MLKYVAVVCFSFCLKSLHFVQLFHYANSCKPSFFTLLCLISFLVMYALDVKVTQAKFLPCNVGFWLTLYLVLSLLSTCIYISLYCVFEMQISPLLLHKELMPPSRASPALSKCPGRVPPAAAVPQPGSSTSLTHKKKAFHLDFDPPTPFRFDASPAHWCTCELWPLCSRLRFGQLKEEVSI